MTRPSVLVVDDEVRSLETIERTLFDEFTILTARSADEAREVLAQNRVQCILCDQRMPGTTGVEFLTSLRDTLPQVPRIIISGYTDVESIIDAVNDAGIYQYITKPWHPETLLLTVRNATRLCQLQEKSQLLANELRYTDHTLADSVRRTQRKLRALFHFDRLVRSSGSPLNTICEQAAQVAPFDASVLIEGESGTGKELLARAIHYHSPRAEKPFVVENCGAMHDELLGSELFGHRKGAFTGAHQDHVGLFERADGGTIFLDEIGEISPAFQVKLLRVLQEGEFRPLGDTRVRKVNVRVVAATNRTLLEDVKAGRFRSDLYYRLATVTLELPPLRERRDDIPLLATHLLEKTAEVVGKPLEGFTEDAMHALMAYDWPGNVRELQNEISRAAIMADGPLIRLAHFSHRLQHKRAARPPLLPEADLSRPLREQVETLEMQCLVAALKATEGNKSRAAELLGLSRLGLRKKLERYGLTSEGAEQ